MPKFFLACRARATYHIEIDARNLTEAKRKAEASIIPGMAFPFTPDGEQEHQSIFHLI